MARTDVFKDINILGPTGGSVTRRPGDNTMNNKVARSFILIEKKN
jgi:hypothetical protein